ncbi:hypothetical protein L3X38_015660 [Prunus dulcis]|uniref:RNase H type-1 domain-containing protein n=1 Tax=Prunus dulcis TaxID=3755 RepID=A0AAD4W3X7_PRUDU|nr:hypothetical protein L3X38_015660 [Prunus dulcis]
MKKETYQVYLNFEINLKASLSTDFNCWLRLNLKTTVVNSFNLRWCNIFATGCWFIWKWRCCSVFDSSFHYPDLPNEWILRFLVEWDIANKKGGVHRPRMQTLLAWKPPPVSIMKLNIDGSRIGSSGAIAAGGLIRNSAGEWVAGFSANLGHGEILVVELWALYHGLKLAQRLQVTKLIVETDSTIVLHLLNAKLEPNHPLLLNAESVGRVPGTAASFMFSGRHKYLESLTLPACKVEPYDLGSFGVLKDLSLVLIDFPISALPRLLSECKFLESLTLKHCSNIIGRHEAELPSLEAAMRPITTQKCGYSAIKDQLNGAIGPAADVVREIEKSLSFASCSDLPAY